MFVMYCVNGESGSSLLIESTDSLIYIYRKSVPLNSPESSFRSQRVGCKHLASEGVFYIGGRGFLRQIIEVVTFARCAFIIALRNIAFGGYLVTRKI